MKEPVIPHPQEQKQYTILDLPKILSNARELSILGYYETSLSKYQIALTIVQDRYKEITEEFIKPKWKMTELNLKSEIAQTKQILELCKTLKNEYFDYTKKQVDTDDISQRKLKDENILVFDMSSGKKQKAQPNISHFFVLFFTRKAETVLITLAASGRLLQFHFPIWGWERYWRSPR